MFLAFAALSSAPDSSGGGRWADGRREQHAGLSYGTSRALYGETAAPLAPEPMWSNSSAAKNCGAVRAKESSYWRNQAHFFMGTGRGVF